MCASGPLMISEVFNCTWFGSHLKPINMFKCTEEEANFNV